MLKCSGMNGPDEGSLEINGWCWFPQIRLFGLIVLSFDMNIWCITGLDRKHEQIYDTDCMKKHEGYAM